jgi:2-methylcitrate dehydratase PrpD
MSATRQLAEAMSGIRNEALGEAEMSAMRVLLLDFIGVAARGAQTDSAITYRRSLRSLHKSADGELSVIGSTDVLPAIPSAMATSLAAHSIEYDDVYNDASLHPGVVVFPTALAASVLYGGDDSAFVRATAIGYEVMCRVGSAANPPAHYRRHFHPTGTAGALGAAAAAAALRDLDPQRMAAAIGIAGTMASGSMAFLDDGAWTKRLNPALAVRAGLESAALAAEGFTGPRDGIAGPNGFLSAFSAEPQPDLLLDGLGSGPLAIARTSVKAHTCCRYCQGPIDAILQLRDRYGVQPDEATEIEVAIPSAAVNIVAEPTAFKQQPQSVVDAQFSVHYAVAVALLFGRASLAEYDEKMLRNPAVLDLARRVRYRTDPAIDRSYPRQWRACCSITTDRGYRYEAWVDDPKGDPANPLTQAELHAKFSDLTAPVYSSHRQEVIASQVNDLGSFPVLHKLVAELAADLPECPPVEPTEGQR